MGEEYNSLEPVRYTAQHYYIKTLIVTSSIIVLNSFRRDYFLLFWGKSYI